MAYIFEAGALRAVTLLFCYKGLLPGMPSISLSVVSWLHYM